MLFEKQELSNPTRIRQADFPYLPVEATIIFLFSIITIPTPFMLRPFPITKPPVFTMPGKPPTNNSSIRATTLQLCTFLTINALKIF
jgi:hypothetical protein